MSWKCLFAPLHELKKKLFKYLIILLYNIYIVPFDSRRLYYLHSILIELKNIIYLLFFTFILFPFHFNTISLAVLNCRLRKGAVVHFFLILTQINLLIKSHYIYLKFWKLQIKCKLKHIKSPVLSKYIMNNK